MRKAVQFSIAALMLFAAWQFYGFAAYVHAGAIGSAPFRPPPAESFLPLAAIVAFKGLLSNGIFDTIHPAGLVILIATLMTGLLFKRALCSWICPIGTLSERLGLFVRTAQVRQPHCRYESWR